MSGRDHSEGRRRFRIRPGLLSAVCDLFVADLWPMCRCSTAVFSLFRRCFLAVNSAVFSTETKQIQPLMKIMNFSAGDRFAVRLVGAKSVIARSGATKQSR